MIAHPPRVEVVIETAADARAAAAGGADRLELCRELPVGGLTPDPALLAAVAAAARSPSVARPSPGSATLLPVVAMLRCRPGDFHYSADELAVMESQLPGLLAAGSAGIVFGAVDAACMPDPAALHRVRAALDAASPCPRGAARPELVFHRAFDAAPDQAAALEILIDCGVDRVLTSGHPDGVGRGLDRLAALLAQSGDRITVMPGGGLRAEHAAPLLALPGLREVHFSARAASGDRTDADRVRALVAAFSG